MGSAIASLAATFTAFAVPACAGAPPDVIVTLKPVHALVSGVMRGVGSPALLLDGAASPHTYALRPSDVRRLANAGVIVRVSKQLEVFLAKPLSQVSSRTQVVTLDEIPGMTLHGLRSGGDFEPHQHSVDDKGAGRRKSGAKHGHDHAPVAQAIDGHLWLDPDNARIAALHIADVLSAAAPEQAGRFKQNAEALVQRLTEFDRQLAAELRPLAGRPYIAFHDAYQYLERRYGLTSAGAVTLNPEVPPSANKLSQLRARLAKRGIVCVFAEPQFPPRAIDTIIEGTQVRRATLDPLGVALPAGPDQYFELMSGLARDLRGCLLPAA